MQGPKAAGTVSGAGITSTGAAGWTPSVKFLIALVAGELFLYGVLRHYTSHGG